jgi:hypothetical protein
MAWAVVVMEGGGREVANGNGKPIGGAFAKKSRYCIIDRY